MNTSSRFLVFGATGRTGQHFVSLALREGHRVRALVRSPEKITIKSEQLELVKGSIESSDDIAALMEGVDFVVCMLGDAKLQARDKINTRFVKTLIPAMRQRGVKRFLYQAGGFSRPYKKSLPLIPWILRNTLARFSGLVGQHEDNESVIEYLVEQAQDIEWVVHRAAIISDAPSKGRLQRSGKKTSLATFADCADYNYRLIKDGTATHSYDLSYYGKH